MRKAAIIDIDGVLNDLFAHLNIVRAREGLGPVPNPTTWDFLEFPKSVREYIFARFRDPLFYKEVEARHGTVEALWALHRHYDIYYLTQRAVLDNGMLNLVMADITHDWLTEHGYPMPDRLLHCLVGAKGAFVRGYFHDQEVAFAVDDSPRAAENYNDHGILCYLLDYPYNRHSQGDYIVRVPNLNCVITWRRIVGDTTLPLGAGVDGAPPIQLGLPSLEYVQGSPTQDGGEQ